MTTSTESLSVDSQQALPVDDVSRAPSLQALSNEPPVYDVPVDLDAEPTPYLQPRHSAEASERWLQIQSQFVDDPRRSVAEAHALVSELMQRIVDSFSSERGELERQWAQGDSVSTEELRVCLQRYRAFFSRLLPSITLSTR
ncbi:MAG: hypothetical protein ACOY0T_14705 [Myxococcota bacterium]